MSREPEPPTSHPEELLAAYVDGSLDPPDREATEAHLATCASCREEVEYAAAARVALGDLPQLDSPGLDMRDLPGLEGEARDSGSRWQRVAWSAGLAAAAVVAVVFLFTGGLLQGDRDQVATRGAPASIVAETPIAVQRGGDRTQESLDALARDLAGSVADSSAPSDDGEAATRAPTAGLGALESAEYSAPEIGQVITCLRQGAALGPENPATYLEEATLDGTPVYVGAFVVAGVEGTAGHLELIAVARADCQPLYFARQTL